MKKISQIIICMLVFIVNITVAQNNSSSNLKIKGIEQLARDRNPELFQPKDEFETNAEYNQRVEKQKTIISQIKNKLFREINARTKERERLASEAAAEDERILENKIAESLAQVEIDIINIGSYDSEKNSFIIKLKNGKNYSIIVPRSEARDFKEKYINVKVEGYKQLNRDLKSFDFFNLVAIHPVTGSRFQFGPTKDIATAPVITSKKSIVPPDLNMKIAFLETNGNGFLDAEEKGKIKISISNSGKGSAMGVIVKLNASILNKELSYDASKLIGEIPSGETKIAEFEIEASKKVQKIVNEFIITTTESYGFQPDPAKLSFETFPLIPAKLEMVDYGVITPNPNNEIRPQTNTDVQVRIQNRGQGTAEDVTFEIILPTGVYFTPESKKNYFFSSLKPDEYKDLEFSFNTSKTVDKTITASIGFKEVNTTGSFSLKLEIAKPQQTIKKYIVSGKNSADVEFSDVATVSIDIEKDIPNSISKGTNDLAVVFGIENYKNVTGVTFARRDAEWIKKYFEKIFGIPENRIYFKTDSDVGKVEFDKTFGKDGWLDKRIKKGESNLFVYYAGHGAPNDKTAYLIPHDGDPNYAKLTGVEMNQFYKQIGELGAQSATVFLDACFSGANRDNKMLLADARPIFMEVNAAAVGNVTVFSAASGTQISSSWPEKKHGLFSYFLMKGMRGDADANKDKKITIGELSDFVKENVSGMAGMLDREQTPGVQTINKNKVLINY